MSAEPTPNVPGAPRLPDRAEIDAAFAERETLRGQRVAVLLTGGNVDSAQFARVLTEPTGTWQA